MRVSNHTRFQPFGQALFGGVHGFDGYFPAPIGQLPTSYDTSSSRRRWRRRHIAVSKRRFLDPSRSGRIPHLLELRNTSSRGDRQNQFRIGAGVLFRGILTGNGETLNLCLFQRHLRHYAQHHTAYSHWAADDCSDDRERNLASRQSSQSGSTVSQTHRFETAGDSPDSGIDLIEFR